MYPLFASTIFADIASKQPNKKALIWDAENYTSYLELDQTSNQIANFLLARGIKKGDRICLILDKYPITYCILLACIKIGAPYFNVDPFNPVSRTLFMLEKCTPKVIFSKTENGFGEWDNLLIKINENNSFEQFQNFEKNKIVTPSILTGNDPIYIMFTSGSTGFPKGVTISHSNIFNFIRWAKYQYNITDEDTFTNVNPLYFDNSVFDIYSSLFNGAALIPFDSETIKDAAKTLKKVDECGATIFFSVPSFLIFFQTLKQVSTTSFSKVRKIIFGGEGYPKPKLKELFDLVAPRIQLVNVYGPTECTCICSSYDVSISDFTNMDGYTAIGSLIPNFSFTLLNEENKAVENDQIGELCLGGPCVGLGYFNNTDLSAKAFIENPDNNLYHDRIYKTGDLMRLSSVDNKLYFVGRKDSQIKHQGYRIELGEIEHALCRVKGVIEAVVLHTTKSGLSSIIGIISSSEKFDTTELKKLLALEIPKYMIPSKIISLETLPKNANGKIDRNLLKIQYC